MRMIASHKLLKTSVLETRIKPCQWTVCADVGPFCRKGLRSPAATCDQTSFNSKIMSPEITAPLSVVPCDIPLSVCLAANRKILSGRKHLQKSPTRSEAADCFSHMALAAATGTGFLNKCLELRLGWLVPPQPHSAQPSILRRDIRPHSRSQSLMC